MNKSRRLIFAIGAMAQVFLLLIAFARPAHAYADPGSGLLMVQIGGSMMAGVFLYIRYKLRRLFRLRSSAEENDSREAGTYKKSA